MGLLNVLFPKKLAKKCKISELLPGEYCMIKGTAMNPETDTSPISRKQCFMYYVIEQDEFKKGKGKEIKPRGPKHVIPKDIAINDDGKVLKIDIDHIPLEAKMTQDKTTLDRPLEEKDMLRQDYIGHKVVESTISHGDEMIVVGEVVLDKDGYLTIVKDSKGRKSFITNKSEKELKL